MLIAIILLAFCVVLALNHPFGDEPGSDSGPERRERGSAGPIDGPAGPTAESEGDTAGPKDSTDPDGDSTETEAEDDSDEHDFEKETAYSVTVRVLDAAGQPIAAGVSILDPRIEWSYGRLPERGLGAFRGFLPEADGYAAEADVDGTLIRALFEVSDENPEAIVVIGLSGTRASGRQEDRVRTPRPHGGAEGRTA